MRIFKKNLYVSFLALIMIFFFNIQAKSEHYNIKTASYLGGEGNENVAGTSIQTDGTLVLAINMKQSGFDNKTAGTLNNSNIDDKGTIIRLSTDGQSVKSITKVGKKVTDISLDGLNNIYVALQDEGALKLSPDASSVIYSVSDIDIHKLDAGQSGFCAMMGDARNFNFNGYQMVRLYNPKGEMLLERYSDNRYKDVGISEKDQMILTAGFNIDFIARNEYHLPFYEGIKFNGARKYIGYNWSADEWAGKNPYEHVRPRTMSIGQDNNMYIAHSWTANANSVIFRDPFDRTKKVNIVGGDKYTARDALSWGEEGDSKVKFGPFRYNIDSGQLKRAQLFAPKSSSGPNYIAVDNPGSITADADGLVYACGISASGLPLKTSSTSEEYFDPFPGDYEGGGFLAIFSQDLSKRLYITRLVFDKLSSISPRRLNGKKVIFSGGQGDADKSGAYTKNAIQNDFGGGNADGYYVVINSPGNASKPTAPANLTIDSSTPAYVSLKWDDNAEKEDGYIIERKSGTGDFKKIATVFYDNTSFKDLTVEEEKNYTYRVKAFNLTGQSDNSNEVETSISSGSPPDAPDKLNAETINEQQIRVTWGKVDKAEGYLIEMKEKDENKFVVKGDVEKGKNSINFQDLLPGIQYNFRIRTYNNNGFSNYSSIVSATTENLKLQDTVNPGNITNGLCYEVYSLPYGQGDWPDFNNLGDPFHSDTAYYFDPQMHSDTGENYAIWYKGYLEVPEDGTYQFKFKVDRGGMLFIDNNLVIDNSGWKWGTFQMSGQVGLKAGKHKINVQHFKTYQGADGLIELKIKGKELSEQLIDKNMLYRKNNCDFQCSVPDAPQLSYEVLSGNKVKLKWQTGKGNNAGYGIERTTYEWNTYEKFKEFIRLKGNVNKYYNNHLIPDSSYQYRMRSFNECGFSPYSNTISLTTDSNTDNSPAPPDYLKINNISSSSISISWRDNSFNEEGFEISVKEESGNYKVIDSSNKDISSYTIENLKSKTKYFIKIRAYNSKGVSSYSNEISGITNEATSISSAAAENSNKILIYPNPAQNFVRIISKKPAKIKIVDVTGKVYYINQRAKEKTNIKVNNWSPGIYFVQLKISNKIINKKIIIN